MKKLMPFSVTAEPSQAPESRFLFHSKRPWLMGVLNATPDSFYAGSRSTLPQTTLRLAGQLIAEGADLLDIGGESTRPGAPVISESKELYRVLPVIEELRDRWPQMPLSVDTQKAAIARQALAKGASVINDISALRQDTAMAEVVAEAKCPVVLMHMQGTPQTMQAAPHYEDVIGEVKAFFEERIAFAVRAGIAEEKIILDPGIGFGKTLEHNLTLLRRLSDFLSLGRPLLVGVSRKSFIGRMLGHDASPLPVEQRLEGSIAAGLWAIQAGASGLRVHDVGPTRHALQLWQEVSHA